MAKKKKLAIIGGGASGLACAIEAARIADNRVEITIYEAGVRVGKKLLGTGNGRCNMLNINACAEDYHGDSAFAKYALWVTSSKDVANALPLASFVIRKISTSQSTSFAFIA